MTCRALSILLLILPLGACSPGAASGAASTKGAGTPVTVGSPVGVAGHAGGAAGSPAVTGLPTTTTPPVTGGTTTPTTGTNTLPPIMTPTQTTPAGGNTTPGGSTTTPPPSGEMTGMTTPPAGGTTGTTAPPPAAGSVTDPTVPAIMGDCPMLSTGSITLSGVSGIEVAAGAKPSSPTAPIVFYWHGTGSFSGEYASMAAQVAAGVQQEGGILISFQNSTGGDLLSGTSVFGMGDFALTDLIYACAVKNYNVDPKRVFTTGCSAGGLFATAMAMLRSSYIAAAAPNSGGLVAPQQFQNKHVPPLMTVHGAPGSDVVIVDFSNTSMTADMTFKQAGGFVIDCNHGGGHCGGAGLAPDIWSLFKAHPFGITPEPWAMGLPSGTNPVCKIQ